MQSKECKSKSSAGKERKHSAPDQRQMGRNRRPGKAARGREEGCHKVIFLGYGRGGADYSWMRPPGPSRLARTAAKEGNRPLRIQPGGFASLRCMEKQEPLFVGVTRQEAGRTRTIGRGERGVYGSWQALDETRRDSKREQGGEVEGGATGVFAVQVQGLAGVLGRGSRHTGDSWSSVDPCKLSPPPSSCQGTLRKQHTCRT